MAMIQIQTNNIAVFGTQRRPGSRNALQTELMQLRLQEKRREMQLREKENERIKLLSERMAEVKNNSDMDWNLRQSVIESLTNQINKIYENRAEREVAAAEREMLRQKAVLEEATQIRDRRPGDANEDKEPQEAREAQERDMMKGLVSLSVQQDRISTLRQTRAALAEEAGHISRAIHSENSNYTLIGSGGGEVIIGRQSGFGNLGDYRNQQLAKLNLGIARTDAAILQAVSSMYRDSVRMQEGWLAKEQKQSDEDQEIPGQARNDE